MPREAELYNGVVLEFPDNTPDEIVQRTVKRRTFELTGNSPEIDTHEPAPQPSLLSRAGAALKSFLPQPSPTISTLPKIESPIISEPMGGPTPTPPPVAPTGEINAGDYDVTPDGRVIPAVKVPGITERLASLIPKSTPITTPRAEAAGTVAPFEPVAPATALIRPTYEGRPVVQQPGGAWAHEKSITIEANGKHMNIPTMFGGKDFTPDQAVEIMRRNNWVDPDTGNPVPTFNTQQEAVAAAQAKEAYQQTLPSPPVSHIQAATERIGGLIKRAIEPVPYTTVQQPPPVTGVEPGSFVLNPNPPAPQVTETPAGRLNKLFGAVGRGFMSAAPFPGIRGALTGEPPVMTTDVYGKPAVDVGAFLNPVPPLMSELFNASIESVRQVAGDNMAKAIEDAMMAFPGYPPGFFYPFQYVKGRLFGWGEPQPGAGAAPGAAPPPTGPLRPLTPGEADAVRKVAQASSNEHVAAALKRMPEADPRFSIYQAEVARRQAGGTIMPTGEVVTPPTPTGPPRQIPGPTEPFIQQPETRAAPEPREPQPTPRKILESETKPAISETYGKLTAGIELRGATPRDTLLNVQGAYSASGPEVLSNLPRGVYEDLAQIPQAQLRAAFQDELPKLLQRMSETRPVETAAVPELRRPEGTEAPPRLQQTPRGGVVLPEVPPSTPSETAKATAQAPPSEVLPRRPLAAEPRQQIVQTETPAERLAKLQGVAETGGREPTPQVTSQEAKATAPAPLPEGGAREPEKPTVEQSPRAPTTPALETPTGREPTTPALQTGGGREPRPTPGVAASLQIEPEGKENVPVPRHPIERIPPMDVRQPSGLHPGVVEPEPPNGVGSAGVAVGGTGSKVLQAQSGGGKEPRRRARASDKGTHPEVQRLPAGAAELRGAGTGKEETGPPIPSAEETPGATKEKVAAGEIESRIQQVKKFKGQEGAKQVRTALIARIEKALEAAPSEADTADQVKEIRATAPARPQAPVRKEFAAYEKRQAAWEKINGPKLDKLEKNSVTIAIPGDGVFKVRNTKEALGELLKRAKQIETRTEPPRFGGVRIPKPTGKPVETEIFNEERLAERKRMGEEAATPREPEHPVVTAEEPLTEKPKEKIVMGKSGYRGSAGYPEPKPAGFPEFRKSPKDVPQSVTPLERNYQPPSPAQKIAITRRGDIIRDMQEAFQVPIRVGHGNFAQMKAAGFFKLKEEVIRLKKANDMEVASHEIGHFLSKKFIPKRAPGLKELIGLGRDLYGTRKPNHGYREEGVAEFVQFYITNPDHLKAKAPQFLKYFEEEFLPKNEDIGDTLLNARADWKRYKEQPAVARVLSQMSVGEKPRRTMTLDGLYRAALDDIHMVKVIENRITEGRPPLNATDSPYSLMRLFSGWTGRAELYLKDGPIAFDTYRSTGGKPLNEILAPFEKSHQLDDLRAYLMARSATDRIKLGQETGLSPADIQETLDTYSKRPEFVKAAEDIYRYQDALLDYALKEGFYSADQVARMRKAHPNHVQFMRYRPEGALSAGGVGGGQFANVGSPIKRAKGGAGEIIDPLESLVKFTYQLISAVDRNEVGKALVKLANSAEGMGKYVERVPADKIPVTVKDFELKNLLSKYGRMKETSTFKTSKTEFTKEIGAGGEGGQPTAKGIKFTEERVMEALKARGFAEGEAKLLVEKLKSAKTDAVINSVIEKVITEQTIRTVTKELELDLPPEMVAAFRPNPKIPGMENIVSVRQDGKPILYQLHPELYEAMAGLDRANQNALIKILSIPAQTLRLGATTFSPEFMIRNPFRDQFTAALYSAYGIINVPGANLPRGIFHVLKKDDLYNAWKASGASHSAMVSFDRGAIQKTLNDVIKSGKMESIAHAIVHHPIDSAMVLNELGEAVTRVGEFARGIKEHGGLTKENILRGGLASQDVTINFSRQGEKVKAWSLNSLIAFFNARLQGLDKMFRFAREHPGLFTARAIATITLPSLALWWMNKDDPRYEELPMWQKMAFWIIPTGDMNKERWAKMTPEEKAKFNKEHTIWRIPGKAFEPGILFGSFPEAAMDWLYKHDPSAVKEYFRQSLQFINPIPTGPLPLVENAMNWSFFRERRLYPRGKEDVEPAYQYGPETGEAAKRAGKILNYSPAKIENLVRGWGGGLGQLGLDVAGIPLKKETTEPEKTLADIPVVRGFVARFPGQPESIERFYAKYGEAQEKKATYDSLRRERKLDEAKQYRADNLEELKKVDDLKGVADKLSNLRKLAEKIREDKTASPEVKRIKIDALQFRMADYAKKALGSEEDRKIAVNE